MIFILGTGRSGTHWLARTLAHVKQFHVQFEDPEIHWKVTMLALCPEERERIFPEIMEYYANSQRQAEPKIYVAKNHPAIWFARDLANAFPDAKFIGIIRSPEGTIASMLKHPGVLSWITDWRKYPIPNRFLGITSELAESYDSLTLPAKCALRWKAHRDELDGLTVDLGAKLHILNFEDMALNPVQVSKSLSGFLGLSHPVTIDVNEEAVFRWKNELNSDALNEIKECLENI